MNYQVMNTSLITLMCRSESHESAMVVRYVITVILSKARWDSTVWMRKLLCSSAEAELNECFEL